MAGNLKRLNSPQLLLIAVLLLFCAALEYYFHSALSTKHYYTHIFYIPIVLAAVWWGWRGGLSVGLILVFMYIAPHFPNLDLSKLTRSLAFVLVGSLLGTMSDWRKRVELALSQSQQWLATTLKSIGDAVIATDAKGLVTFLNPVAKELTGWDEAEAVGKPVEDIFVIINEQTGEQVENPVAKVLREGVVVGLGNDTILIAKDGTKRPVADSGAPMRDKKGNIIGTVMVFRDVTDRKRTEEQLAEYRDHLEELVEKRTTELAKANELLREEITERKEAEKALRESERELAILNQIAQIFLTAPDEEMYGEVMQVVLKALESKFGVFGYIDENGALVVPSVTRGVWDACQVPEKDIVFPREIWGDSIWPSAIRQKKTLYSNERSTRTPEGHIPILRNISLPIIDQEEVVGLFQVANKEMDYDEKDIQLLEMIGNHIAPILHARLQRDRLEKARRKAELELQRHRDHLAEMVEIRTRELTEANKELESFNYSVSHDLRAPLRAISGFSAILTDEYSNKLDSEGERILSVIQENTQTMGQLIDGLLVLSRLGRQQIRSSRIDMEKLAQEVSEELEFVTPGPKPHLTISSLPPCYGDPGLIRQVFANLLSNAMKFTTGKMDPEIEISGNEEEQAIIYSVKDNGVGFDMQYVGKLFGVFQRLHSATEFAGSGIGLANVKRIVARHGGHVWAEGKLGEGATFYFTLPKSPVYHKTANLDHLAPSVTA